MDIGKMIDGYDRLAAVRGERLRRFHDPAGDEHLLVIQRPPAGIWNDCNTVATIVRNNLAYLEACVALDWSDDLPYLEPWIGTGVFANAFGCEYVFRDFDAPHTHYACRTVEEALALPPPDWRRAPIMGMVLATIDALKEATRGRIPISLTDTQSAFDTATLVMDASEFFIACYTEEKAVLEFMRRINELIIAFSHAQIERIGDGLVARPGHIMTGAPFLAGISLSDDNLAVSSPEVNARISLPSNAELAAAFGGLAIHSCGTWTHTMAAAAAIPGVTMLDMALAKACDPNPNDPRAVRDALRGTGVVAKVRVGGDMDEIEGILRDLYAPDLKLAVEIAWSPEHAEANYRRIRACHERLAAKGTVEA
jgi:hypothetical protein